MNSSVKAFHALENLVGTNWNMIIDPMVISAPETQSAAAAASILVAQSEVEFAVCDCCGL